MGGTVVAASSGVLRRLARSPDALAAPAARVPRRGVDVLEVDPWAPAFFAVAFVAGAFLAAGVEVAFFAVDFFAADFLAADVEVPALVAVAFFAVVAISRSSLRARRG
ncbi:hypothetical protein BJM39_31175 [Salmonella enterica subsp. enterica serovar Javiana]|nr:hypothetical protein BJM39_31175 [Salmonella enterica subsp. enterica serovar Javiana]